MRKFPALIHCCILDWFMPWSLKALERCCKKSFSHLQYEEDIKTKLVKLVCQAHSEVETLRDDFLDEFGRKVYITPMSFLDMISILEDGMFRNSIKTRKYLMNNFKIDLIQMS